MSHTLVTELSLPIRHSLVSCKNQKIDPFDFSFNLNLLQLQVGHKKIVIFQSDNFSLDASFRNFVRIFVVIWESRIHFSHKSHEIFVFLETCFRLLQICLCLGTPR